VMDRMARGAYDVIQGVLRAAYVCTIEFLLMARKARVQDSFRRQHRECVRNRCLAAARFDVSLSWTMAAFATSALRRLYSARDRLVMRIPEEIRPNIRMTGFAYRASDVSVPRLGW
jgi:hypothetical protein